MGTAVIEHRDLQQGPQQHEGLGALAVEAAVETRARPILDLPGWPQPAWERVAYMAARRPLDILLVEDSPTDVEIALEAFNTARYPARVTVVTDGQEAIDHLQSLTDRARRPDLVLLDWRLPRVSGRQVLDFIRSEPKLRSMPVVVLSSSTDEADVTASYEGCANCWVSKPLDMDEYIRAVQSISGFWSNVARLPRG